MPFDGKTFARFERTAAGAVRSIREMRKILASPDAWCQNAYQSGNAFCLLGAQSEAAMRHGYSRRGWAAVCAALVAELPEFVSVSPYGLKNFVTFNDAPTTTHSDVLALLDRAEARLMRLAAASPSLE